MNTQESTGLTKAAKGQEFPYKKKVGNTTATIYRNANKLRGGIEFKLSYYDLAGKRRFRSFPDLKGAKAQLNTILEKAAKGELETLDMAKVDLVAYTRAVKALEPYNIPVDTAAEAYCAVLKELSGHATPIEAARFYLKAHPHTLPVKSVSEVYNELIEAKTKAGRSAVYITDLRYRCGAFAKAFQMPIASVTSAEVRRFLDSLDLSPRSYNNFMRAIHTLFEFAKSRKYLLADHNILEGIEGQDETGEEIQIYSPEQMAKLLGAASADALPVIAIAGFAGLRTAEIMRLTWNEIDLAERFIEIKKSKAKTRSRRTVPIVDNLAAWLAPYATRQGAVWPHSVAFCFETFKATADKAGVKWQHNALRHSFCSYRLAAVKNENQVAMEAGNSPAMIHANYNNSRPEKQAKAWFSIMPAQAANVIALPAASAVVAG